MKNVIQTISLNFSGAKDRMRRRFCTRATKVPLIGDFPPLMKMLRSSRRGPVTFRLNDAPKVVVEWHRFGRTAAVTYLVERGDAKLATLQLTGLKQSDEDDALAHIAAIIPAFASWMSENAIKAARPLLTMITLEEIDNADVTPIIPLICLMPAQCELAELALDSGRG